MREDCNSNWREPEPLEAAWTRSMEIAAVLTAIDAGELLAELPQRPEARVRHRVGVALLAVLNREVSALVSVLEGAMAT